MEKITGEFFLGKMLGFRVELFLARSSMTVTSIVDEVVVSNRGKTRSSWRRLFGKGTRKSRDVRRSKADDYRIPSDSFCRGHVVSSAELVIWFVDAISRHIQSRMIGLDPCLDFVASSSSSIFFVKNNPSGRIFEAMLSRKKSIIRAIVRSREMTMGNNADPALLLEC